MSVHPPARRHGGCILLLVILLSAGRAEAGEHPRLLIAADDLPRLRHACGVGDATGAPAAWGKFGRRAADYQILRSHVARGAAEQPLPGELAAAAFLHLIDSDDPRDASRLALVNRAFRKPNWITGDIMEMVLALDWCWDDLEPPARRSLVLALREGAEPLVASDSPLYPRVFRKKLAALALAIAVDEEDDPNPSWALLRATLLKDGRQYVLKTLPTFVEWRGLSPTGIAVAAREENDTALLLELGGHLVENDLWAAEKDTLGRWLEHYVFAGTAHPALRHHFIRDDGNAAPLTPAPAFDDLLPVTAHLIAARTGDPAAALVARQVEADLRTESSPLAGLWRWVPIALDIHDVAAAKPAKLPLARNLGSSVVFRSGIDPTATAVWIDAAQPCLRRRQHFDAGHFLVYRGGHLAIDAAQDITFEAVPSKKGKQRLGRREEPFDFEQFFTATIAHNALLCWDAARVEEWYGSRYLPAGGQRPIEGTCDDFTTPLAAQERATGRQLAYGQHDGAAYLALDLQPAYNRRVFETYTREFIFAGGNILVVVDRAELVSGRSPPTWILNLPARPTVDGDALTDVTQIAGATNDAGVWLHSDAQWVRWTENDGAAWLAAVRPSKRQVRLVGGPAETLRVAEGQHKGRPYIGGEPAGYERLIIPAPRRNARNAWYRLGDPTLLGPAFGKTPVWGRVEIEPTEPNRKTHLFVTVLVTGRAASERPPELTVQQSEEQLHLTVGAGDGFAELHLPLGLERGGAVRTSRLKPTRWTLPDDVANDAALPVE